MIDDEWSWYHAAWCTLSTIHHSQVSGGDKIEPYMFSRPIALKLNAQEGADPASGRDAPVDPWAILVEDECWWHKMMISDGFSRWWMCSSFWVLTLSDMLKSAFRVNILISCGWNSRWFSWRKKPAAVSPKARSSEGTKLKGGSAGRGGESSGDICSNMAMESENMYSNRQII